MWTEEKLDKLLSRPSEALVSDMRKIDGDIMILGAGGKMGPTLCLLAKNAILAAGISKRVIAVSRFTDPIATKLLQSNGIETISCDLLDVEQLNNLPFCENIIYMAGRKFGTDGNEWQTWSMNATLPAFVAHKFRDARIVVFSSGNIYPIVPLHSGGCTEQDKPVPVGEYAMSCLARERAFEYVAHAFGTKVYMYRLNFAVDLRYGVLYDIACNIMAGQPVSLNTPVFNCIWQGSANEIALRGLLHADAPPCVMNVTGPETVSVKKTALRLGKLLGRPVNFVGVEQDSAYLNDSARSAGLYGYPSVSMETLIQWQAEWILDGGRGLDKPTHFEERKGSY